MSFVVEITEEAEKTFRKFEVCCQRVLADRLRNIADSPRKHSRPATLPYFPKGHVSHAECDHPDQDFVNKFSIHFMYRADETTLVVFAFGYFKAAK